MLGNLEIKIIQQLVRKKILIVWNTNTNNYNINKILIVRNTNTNNYNINKILIVKNTNTNNYNINCKKC